MMFITHQADFCPVRLRPREANQERRKITMQLPTRESRNFDSNHHVQSVNRGQTDKAMFAEPTEQSLERKRREANND